MSLIFIELERYLNEDRNCKKGLAAEGCIVFSSFFNFCHKVPLHCSRSCSNNERCDDTQFLIMDLSFKIATSASGSELLLSSFGTMLFLLQSVEKVNLFM